MTKREKVLLFILIIGVLAIAPYFLVTKGLIAELKKLDQEYQQLADKKTQYEQVEGQMTVKESEYAKYQDEIAKRKATMPMPEKSYDAHYTFTKLTEKNGLKITKLSIGSIENFDLPPQTAANNETAEQTTDGSEATEQTSDVGETSEPTSQSSSEAVTSRLSTCSRVINLEVKGRLVDVLSFIDDVNTFGENFKNEVFQVSDMSDLNNVTVKIQTNVYMVLSPEEKEVK